MRHFISNRGYYHAGKLWHIYYEILRGILMKQRYYRLNDKNEVEPCSIEEWGVFHDSPKKLIKQEDIGERFVSTVFVGINYNFGNSGYGHSRPIVFETMIFSDNDDPVNEYCERHATYQEAIERHDSIVKQLIGGTLCDT